MTGRSLLLTAAGRLRAPWRLIVFALAAFAAFELVGAVLYPAAALLGQATGTHLAPFEWHLAASLLLAHVVVLAWVDRSSLAEAWMGREALRPRGLARGAALGALCVGLPSLALLAVHWLRAEPNAAGSWWGAAAGLAASLAPAAFWEELLFRGYVFTVLREAVGAVAAVVVTSVLFGLAHAQNLGADAQAITLVSLAGVFLAAVLLATRSLYAAWAAHLAWNWTMAALFHIAVSGNALPAPNYVVRDAGPDWATGGAWGPEGGAGAALGMIGGLLFLAGGPNGRRALTMRRPRREENTA